jgi:hypothetical protein
MDYNSIIITFFIALIGFGLSIAGATLSMMIKRLNLFNIAAVIFCGIVLFASQMNIANFHKELEKNLMIKEHRYNVVRTDDGILSKYLKGVAYKEYTYRGYDIKYLVTDDSIIILK